jgi:outer membrane receptor protein involved in Fe transport
MVICRIRGLLTFALVCLSGLLAVPSALGQDAADRDAGAPGAVAGVVVDGREGDPLPGVNVSIAGTATGTATDLNGRYRLGGLEPGTYDLQFSFVGFQQKTVSGVEVAADQTTRIEVSLAEQTRELDEVVVSAEAARDSEAGLLKRRAKAAAVSDAISAETIGRAGAGTVADAMSMVTGASVVEGKYVNVRGLQGRYVDTHLNGSDLPSTDPDGNSVALDIFPSSLIDNVVTTKTFTPDRPGTFTGGAIDVTTKSFPDDRFLTLSVSSAFNSEVGLGGNVLRPSGGLGALPGVVERTDLPESPPPFFTDAGRKVDALSAVTGAFTTPMAPRREEIVGNRGAELAFGDQFSVLGDRPLGVIAALSYDQSFSGYEGGTTARFNQTGLGSQTLNPEASYATRRGVDETLASGLLGLSFQPHSRHELGVRVLYTRDDEQEARVETGRLPRDLAGDSRFRTRVSRTTERSVASLELSGSHRFGAGTDGVRAEWSASRSEATRDEPDYRFFSNQFSVAAGDTSYAISPSIFLPPTRYFRTLDEGTWSGRASVEVPVGDGTVEAGGRLHTTTRTFRERTFLHSADRAQFTGTPNAYVTDQAGVVGTDERGRTRFGTYVQDFTDPRNNYDGDQSVGAGYLMTELPVPGLPALTFVGGARLEYTDMSIATLGESPRRGAFETTDLLPSANLTWALRDDMNLRLAYGRTIARPTFREFAPFESFQFVGDYIERGNPDLDRTRVHNLDVRWEWFRRRGELLSAGVFYKDFTDPIERTIDPEAAANQVITYVNRSGARVYGVELEARTRLDGLAGWLRHVQVGGNLTLTESQVSRPDDVLQAIRAFDVDASDTRPLQGQSPYLLNLNAGYVNPETGTSVNVFFNRFGDRLDTVTRNGVDLYEQGRSLLDVNASQRLLRGVEVTASVKNVLDSEKVVSQSFKGTEFVNDLRPLGRTVSVGVSYSF